MLHYNRYAPGEDREMEGCRRHGGGPGRGEGCRPPREDHWEEGPVSLDRQLMRTLGRLSRGMRARHGEWGGQRRILALLDRAGDMTQRELTKLLGIQPGSVSEIIGKMEVAGLLTRSASDADRRTANVSLTDEGHRRAAELREQDERSRLFGSLTEEEKSVLLTLLQKVEKDLPDLPDPWEGRRGSPQGEGPHPHKGPGGHGRGPGGFEGPGGPRRHWGR